MFKHNISSVVIKIRLSKCINYNTTFSGISRLWRVLYNRIILLKGENVCDGHVGIDWKVLGGIGGI